MYENPASRCKLRNNRPNQALQCGFNQFVRDDCTQEGIHEFFRATRVMVFNQPSNHFIMVVVAQGKIVGMIDIKENRHICLFFVDSSYQRQGVGKALLDHALAYCLRNTPEVTAIDVHSSLFAVPIYKKLGFRQTKPEQIRNGIRFVEMVKQLQPQSGYLRLTGRNKVDRIT